MVSGYLYAFSSRTSQGRVRRSFQYCCDFGKSLSGLKMFSSLQAGQKFPPAGQLSLQCGMVSLMYFFIFPPNHKISRQRASRFAYFFPCLVIIKKLSLTSNPPWFFIDENYSQSWNEGHCMQKKLSEMLWLLCIKIHSYTPRTLRACCSQSKFRILKLCDSSARALFLYNCTPNISCSADPSVSVA